MLKALRFLPLLFGGLLLASCSDDDGNEPNPGIAVSLGGAITVVQGHTASTLVTVTRAGGFDGAVTLTATDLPTGVTAAFEPGTIPAGSGNGTSLLLLTAAGNAAIGGATFSVAASGGENLTATTNGSVTVNSGPDFSLAVAPTTLSIQQGANGTANVTITRLGGFTGSVHLSVGNLPTGVTAAFDNADPTGPAAVLTLTVGAGAATGTTNLSIEGVEFSQGTPGTRSVTLALTVTVAPPPGPGNGNLKFCDLDNLPIWFAYQDGNGPWTQVTGTVAGDGTTYTFNITQSTGAFSYVSGNAPGGFTTTVFFGTQTQLTDNAGQCVSPNAGRTLNGSVAGIDATDQVAIAMGGGVSNASTATPNFQLKGVLNGASDLIAVRNSLGIIIRRGLDIADGGTIPVLDFAAAEAFAPQPAQVTLNNLGGDTPMVALGYQTPTTVAPGLSTSLSGGTAHTVYGVPAAKQDATDLHQLSALAASGNAGDARGHEMWFKTLADKTVTLGPVLTPPTIASLGNTPYPRYSSSGPIQAEYDDGFSFTASQPDAATWNTWSITATRGYFAGSTYTLLMPDMSAAGYQPLWALQVGILTTLGTSAFGFSDNGFTPPQVEGGFGDFATRIGLVTP